MSSTLPPSWLMIATMYLHGTWQALLLDVRAHEGCHSLIVTENKRLPLGERLLGLEEKWKFLVPGYSGSRTM